MFANAKLQVVTNFFKFQLYNNKFKNFNVRKGASTCSLTIKPEIFFCIFLA